MQTERTLEQRNEAQRKTITELSQGLKDAGKQIADLQIWERFAGYLLDHCEGQTVTEENLQGWLSQMLADEKKDRK